MTLAADDIVSLSALALRDAFTARTLSPVEALDASVNRIADIDGSVGAFWTLNPQAEEAALDSERRYAEGRTRPLEGIPLAVKDLFDTVHCPTTYGSPMFAGHLPAKNAEAVELALRAGAVLVGKTSTDEFAYGITSNNPHFGPVRNPWDKARVSGGSSGGSAAALALDEVPLALGSDTGGSVRAPAGFCGIVGFKPTWGLVPVAGMFPMARSLDHVGTMARTVADAALLFDVVAGHSSSAVLPVAELNGVRVAVCPDLHLVPLEGDVARVFHGSVGVLAELGADIVETTFPAAETIFPTFLPIQQVETAWTHRRRGLFPERRSEYGADVVDRLEIASRVTLNDYLAALDRRETIRQTFDGILATADVLVTPVSASAPVLLDTPALEDVMREAIMFFMVAQDLLGLPACAVRAGFDRQGLPVGLQIVGGHGLDADVLQVAEAFAAAIPEIQARRPNALATDDQPEEGTTKTP